MPGSPRLALAMCPGPDPADHAFEPCDVHRRRQSLFTASATQIARTMGPRLIRDGRATSHRARARPSAWAPRRRRPGSVRVPPARPPTRSAPRRIDQDRSKLGQEAAEHECRLAEGAPVCERWVVVELHTVIAAETATRPTAITTPARANRGSLPGTARISAAIRPAKNTPPAATLRHLAAARHAPPSARMAATGAGECGEQ